MLMRTWPGESDFAAGLRPSGSPAEEVHTVQSRAQHRSCRSSVCRGRAPGLSDGCCELLLYSTINPSYGLVHHTVSQHIVLHWVVSHRPTSWSAPRFAGTHGMVAFHPSEVKEDWEVDLQAWWGLCCHGRFKTQALPEVWLELS